MRSRTQKRWRRFQKLQWKLMRSYMVVTVSAVLIIYLFIGALLGYVQSRPSLSPEELTTSARGIAARVSGPLSASSPDKSVILKAIEPLLQGRMSVAVTDRRGKIVAGSPEWIFKDGSSLFSETGPEVKVLASAALANRASSRLAAKDAEGNPLAVVPVFGAKGQVIGLLLLRMTAPVSLSDFSRSLIFIMLVNAVVVGIFATFVGLGFGFLNARQLTRRLKAISDAADAWSRGEFSTVAIDDSEDELGQLARRLNDMAGELRELVVLRQNLATSEERNRLSRELHDTVKQQVFATTMQVGAARVLLDRDVDLARTRLIEGERLASEAQRELTVLLEQLRPGSYLPLHQPNETLESLIRAHVRDWSRPNSISAEVILKPIPTLARATQQALFRITQEALANVARHSGATEVRVQLEAVVPSIEEGAASDTVVGRRVVLTIQDNGRGFAPLHTAGGFGFQSMRERAEALPMGTLVVESRLDIGTRVEVACSDIGVGE